VLISGATSSSSGIASPDAFQPTKNGSSDAYLAEFSLDGAYIGGTYFGGSKKEPYDIGYGPAVALDAEGNVYITPTSISHDVPNALNILCQGNNDETYDAVLTRFGADAPRIASPVLLPTVTLLSSFPNPAGDMITLQLSSDAAASATIRFSDINGNTLLSTPVTVTEGLNQMPIKLGGLPSGSYYVTIDENKERSLPKWW
jgi:hypothetical protein